MRTTSPPVPSRSSAPPDPTSWRDRATVPTLVAVTGLMALISSLGAPLIPSIARTEGVSLSTGEWLLTATLMIGAVATPAMGRFTDGPSKRGVIRLALLSVVAGCVLSALAPNFTGMVLGRGLQGVGLGLLAVTIAVARSVLPPHRLGRTIATLSVTTAVGGGLGYPLTGLISDAWGFRAAFWAGAIATAAALILAEVVLPKHYSSPVRTFDTAGAVSLGLAVAGIIVVLSEGGNWGWTSPAAIAIVVFSILLVGLWVRHELRVADPLVDVRLVRNRSVLTADVSVFLSATAMYLFLPVIVEFVQVPKSSGYGFGASAMVSGLVLVPLSVGSFLSSRCLPVCERRFGTRSMIPFGSIVFALAAVYFAFEHRYLWEAFVVAGICGIGIGFTFAAMPGFVVRAVAPSETGSATGFYQLQRALGLAVGSALAAAVLTAYTAPACVLPGIEGFKVSLLVAAALCLVTAILSYVLLGGKTTETALTEELIEMMEEDGEVASMSVMLSEQAPVGSSQVRAP